MSKNEPKYLQIATEIREDILDGRLRPGDALPSINVSSKEWCVNRSTVDRAYKILSDEGYVVPMQGRGYYVVEREPEPETSSDMRVFWSYAHSDDERSCGGITRLRESIQAEYELITGSAANIFQDTKDIEWGMDWRQAIENSLGTTTYFIPILTPSYLRSPHCLAELRTAKARFEALGFPEGIYPIEFVDCAKTIRLMADDSLASLLSDRQRRRRWTALRLEDPSSSEYRKEVHSIVGDLLKHEKQWEGMISTLLPKDIDTEFLDEYDGDPLASVARIEGAVGQLAGSMQLIEEDVAKIGDAFQEERLPSNSGAQQALAFAGRLATRLDGPSTQLEKHCNDYDNQMEVIDEGLDGMLELRRIILDVGGSDPTGPNLLSLRDQIAGMLDSTGDSFEQIEPMRATLRNFSRIARVLRKPCQRIDVSLGKIATSRHIMRSWASKLGSAMKE